MYCVGAGAAPAASGSSQPGDAAAKQAPDLAPGVSSDGRNTPNHPVENGDAATDGASNDESKQTGEGRISLSGFQSLKPFRFLLCSCRTANIRNLKMTFSAEYQACLSYTCQYCS